MTSPVPLCDSHGELYGYACWHCRWPALGYDPVGEGARPTADLLVRWRQAARECCVCSTCNQPLPDGCYRAHECPRCQAESDRQSSLRTTEYLERTQECPSCAGGLGGDCSECGGWGRVSYAGAAAPPTEDPQ